MRILYFNNSAFGGLAQYAHFQANALADAGCEVDFLCPPNFPDYEDRRYNAIKVLSAKAKRTGASKLARLSGFFKEITSDIKSLVKFLESNSCQHVLFGSYLEYFSPFWIGSLNRVKKRGIVFGTVLHDPIRDTALGPAWWHRYSVKKAYDFVDFIFIHQILKDPSANVPTGLPQFVVPHGPYPVDSRPISKEDACEKLKLPKNRILLLSFGHIRDNKNLDLAIKSLATHPEIHLVVAGQSLNETQKQPEDYKLLAKDHQVEDQITWFTDYIPDEDVNDFFCAADGILLTYSKGFRSASGVLNLAAALNKPCIASSGPSPLEDLVKQYSLGIWVNPDDAESLTEGMSEFKKQRLQPDWEGYRKDNSWERNAHITMDAFLKFGGAA